MLLHKIFTFSYGIVTKPIAIGLGLEEEKRTYFIIYEHVQEKYWWKGWQIHFHTIDNPKLDKTKEPKKWKQTLWNIRIKPRWEPLWSFLTMVEKIYFGNLDFLFICVVKIQYFTIKKWVNRQNKPTIHFHLVVTLTLHKWLTIGEFDICGLSSCTHALRFKVGGHCIG